MALQKRNALEFQITNNPGKTKHFGEAREYIYVCYHFYLNSTKQYFIAILIFFFLCGMRNSINLEYMFSKQGIFLEN